MRRRGGSGRIARSARASGGALPHGLKLRVAIEDVGVDDRDESPTGVTSGNLRNMKAFSSLPRSAVTDPLSRVVVSKQNLMRGSGGVVAVAATAAKKTSLLR
jgi:hypothetical protein